ncbi:uncharacterized protein LOC126772552 [Nymphalis io]|uniref:uncharacterized protein LOC126772552 n=1 Tax=Inachis io TaxID=171585 RepID=UPI00216967FC|nr:uncharacterized protein LOC126772552 [Nymphalis io]
MYGICLMSILIILYSVFSIQEWSNIETFDMEANVDILEEIPMLIIALQYVICLMTYTCDKMSSKRTTTKILVNELIMDYNLPNTMRIQAKAFMEIIELRPLKIIAYDMFPIDIKLLLKFVSISTTYLIVIIQVSHFL